VGFGQVTSSTCYWLLALELDLRTRDSVLFMPKPMSDSIMANNNEGDMKVGKFKMVLTFGSTHQSLSVRRGPPNQSREPNLMRDLSTTSDQI
jgi:hypothetical protein